MDQFMTFKIVFLDIQIKKNNTSCTTLFTNGELINVNEKYVKDPLNSLMF